MTIKLITLFMLGAACVSAFGASEGDTNVRFEVVKVVWPYPVSIEAVDDAGLVETRIKTVALIVVKGADLDRFRKNESGYVTAFVSIADEKAAPKVGKCFKGRFKAGELWKINMPLQPKEPPFSFIVLENARDLESVDCK